MHDMTLLTPEICNIPFRIFNDTNPLSKDRLFRYDFQDAISRGYFKVFISYQIVFVKITTIAVPDIFQ
jgi:hypothetical protein